MPWHPCDPTKHLATTGPPPDLKTPFAHMRLGPAEPPGQRWMLSLSLLLFLHLCALMTESPPPPRMALTLLLLLTRPLLGSRPWTLNRGVTHRLIGSWLFADTRRTCMSSLFMLMTLSLLLLLSKSFLVPVFLFLLHLTTPILLIQPAQITISPFCTLTPTAG